MLLEENSKAIVCVDCPEGVEPYYTIYNYDRSGGLIIVIGIFVLLVALIGGKQGIRSCIALCFTLLMMFCYLLPRLFEGENATGITMITVALSCAVTCFCIGGISKKTALNIISAVLGGISAGVMYYICTAVLVAFSLSIIRLFLLKNEEYPIYTPCGLSYWYMALGISFLCDKASQTIVRFANQYVGENYTFALEVGVICIFVFFLYYILDGEMFALDVSITFTPMICDALKFDILNLNIINIIVVSILLNLILQVLIKLHVLDIFINFIKKWLYTPKYIFYWWYVILLFPVFAVRTILKFIKKPSKNN